MRNTVTTLILAGSSSALLALPAEAVELQTDSGWKATVRGFVAVDADYDQHDLGGSEPLFPPQEGSKQASKHALRFSANQSQLGFGLQAPNWQVPDWGEFTSRGYIEIDFLKGLVTGTNENKVSAVPRLRHAYWQLGWNNDSDTLIVGQTNVLFGDLLPDVTFDNLNLALGSLFGREPQVQYAHVSPLSSGSDITYAVSINAPNSGLFNHNPLDPLYVGLGWDWRKANYNDGLEGKNNRINLSLFYNF